MWTLTSNRLPPDGREVLILCDKRPALAVQREGGWFYTTSVGEYPVRSEVECWRDLERIDVPRALR